MTAKELRNEIVNRLWSYGSLPKNIQTLMTDNEVDFVMEVIKTHVQEQLNLYNVVEQSEQCTHENEVQRQGDGFIYTVCGDCGEDLD